MSERYEITDVPEIELERQMNILKQDGVTSVTSKKQSDGRYTIIAIYPSEKSPPKIECTHGKVCKK